MFPTYLSSFIVQVVNLLYTQGNPPLHIYLIHVVHSTGDSVLGQEVYRIKSYSVLLNNNHHGHNIES